MEYPSHHPNSKGIFPNKKPSSYWGAPMAMEPPTGHGSAIRRPCALWHGSGAAARSATSAAPSGGEAPPPRPAAAWHWRSGWESLQLETINEIHGNMSLQNFQSMTYSSSYSRFQYMVICLVVFQL